MYHGAGVLLCYEGRNGYEVLLGKRIYNPFAGTWSVPGGKREYGESFRKAAFREMKEELRLLVKRGKKMKYYTLTESTTGIPFLFKFQTFIVKVNYRLIPRVKSPKEFSRVDWFPIDKLPDNMHFGVYEAVEKLKREVLN